MCLTYLKQSTQADIIVYVIGNCFRYLDGTKMIVVARNVLSISPRCCISVVQRI